MYFRLLITATSEEVIVTIHQGMYRHFLTHIWVQQILTTKCILAIKWLVLNFYFFYFYTMNYFTLFN